MSAALLKALERWLARHSDTPAQLTIPTGRVDAAELARVLLAIFDIPGSSGPGPKPPTTQGKLTNGYESQT